MLFAAYTQSHTTIASANGALQATQAPTMAATASVPANPPAVVNIIPGSSIPVLGGAGTETWTPTYIAQQNFQRGYMFWISTSKTIWVLTKTNEKDNSGVWTVFPDTFVDGEAETDPAIVPPSAALYQPRRGFGKVWRKQTGVSEALGWGTTPEFEVTTPISYLSGASGVPGRYLLTTLGREIFSLIEDKAGQPGGKWQLVGIMVPGNASNPAPVAPAPQGTQSATFGAVTNPSATMAATTKP
jgi:hypothetical protein